MDIAKRQNLVVYLDNSKILIYQGSTGSISEISLSENSISDQEIINKEIIEQSLENFIDDNKIDGGSVIFVFGPTLVIEKDFDPPMSKKLEEEIQDFINIIPYEEVISKNYNLNKKIKVIGINQEIFDLFKNEFSRRNFVTQAAIPSTVLQETVTELSHNLDLAFIANKILDIKQYSIIDSLSGPERLEEKTKEQFRLSKRVLFLLVFLLFLVSILLFLIFKPASNNSGASKSKQSGNAPQSTKTTNTNDLNVEPLNK